MFRHLPLTLLGVAIFGFAALTPHHVSWAQDADPPADEQADDCLEYEEPRVVTERRMDRSSIKAASIRVPGPAQRAHITPEIQRNALEVARRINPDLGRRLRQLCDDNPEACERAMLTSGRRLLQLAELKELDPKLYALKLQELLIQEQVNNAARELKEAIDNGSPRVEQLRDMLTQRIQLQLALSLKARVEYLQRLRAHVQALEDEINRDASNFTVGVETTLDEVLRQHGIPPADDGEVRAEAKKPPNNDT